MSEKLTKLREAVEAHIEDRAVLPTIDPYLELSRAALDAALAAVEQEMNALRVYEKRWAWMRASSHLTTDDDGCLVLVAGIAMSLQEASWLKDDEHHALGGVIPLPADHDPMLESGCVYRGDALDRAVDYNIAAEIADALERPI